MKCSRNDSAVSSLLPNTLLKSVANTARLQAARAGSETRQTEIAQMHNRRTFADAADGSVSPGDALQERIEIGVLRRVWR